MNKLLKLLFDSAPRCPAIDITSPFKNHSREA